MKHLRTLLLVFLCAVMVLLCACPAPTPPAPGSSTTTTSGSGSGSGSGGGSQPGSGSTSGSGSGSQPGSSGSGSTPTGPTLPLGAVYRPSDTGERAEYWQKLSAPTGNFATGAYTAAADGLSNESATPASGTDLAYGFKAPYDGTYEVGADMLALAAANGAATLTVYKNGSKIWPVSEDVYNATTENGTARFTATTAAKKGEMLYIRISGNTTLNISPRVTLVSGAYSENRDIEKNFPTVGTLDKAGASIPADNFVMQELTPPATVTTISAADLQSALLSSTLTAGGAYRVEGDLVIDAASASAAINGNGAFILTTGKVTIKNLKKDLTNLSIHADGGVTLESTIGVTVSRLQIKGGLTLAASAENITLESSRLVANGTALENHSAALNLLGCYLAGGSSALTDTAEEGSGLYVNCIFKAYHTAVHLGASDTTMQNCTVYGDVESGENLENLMVAYCTVKNVGAIRYGKLHNSVVIFTEAENVLVKNTTNAYICENAIYGSLFVDNVRYFLAEDNILPTADPTLVAVRDYNGDSVTDVTARAEYGVNEDLLPHVNYDAFVGMTRKQNVRTLERKSAVIGDYISENLKSGTDLVIAPGAYNGGSLSRIKLEDLENANLYAYGVLFERTTNFGGYFFDIVDCKYVSIYGLTYTLTSNSSGHAIVLEKLPGGKVLCAPGAGMSTSWTGNLETLYHGKSPAPVADIEGSHTPTYDEATGLWTFSFGADIADAIEVGDFITCRIGGSLSELIGNTHLYFEDVSIFGSAVRCFWDNQAIEGSELHRVIDVPMPAFVIDEATYNRYKGYETQYGVYTGVYIDEMGNYRGTPSRTATADATHTSYSRTGMKVTSCFFNGLSDDATNHQGNANRLAGYDAKTGELLYKPNNPSLSNSTSAMLTFSAGDLVTVYSSNGRLICDTVALANSTRDSSTLYRVKIDKNAIDPAVLEDYDLDSNISSAVKLLVDNRSKDGNGLFYDNVKVSNIRSRGFLIKSSGNTVQHCSFYNIGMGAIAINFELEWGETGICRDTVVKNNYIENTGYYSNFAKHTPISVYGLASQGEEDRMLFENIVIEHNKVVDRGATNALFICGAKNVTVKDNDFGDHKSWENTPAVYVTFSQDIEFSGNTYSSKGTTAATEIIRNEVRGLSGTDVAGLSEDRLTSASFVSSYMENVPYVKVTNGNRTKIYFKKGWDVGYYSRTDSKTFTKYTHLEPGRNWWYTDSTNSPWTPSGGVGSEGRDFRLVSNGTSNAAIRYTADRAGEIALSIARYAPPWPQASGVGYGDGLFAIFVNGEMVWPKAGGDYTGDADWYLITDKTSESELNAALATLTLSVKKSDTVSFVSRLKTGEEWCGFGVAPNVYYLK